MYVYVALQFNSCDFQCGCTYLGMSDFLLHEWSLGEKYMTIFSKKKHMHEWAAKVKLHIKLKSSIDHLHTA